MVELSIEEKAKAYDKALKVLRKYDGANIILSQSLKEEMFPELVENRDEKVKKSINRLIRYYHDVNFPTPEGFSRKDLLDWLEKQGEQKDILEDTVLDSNENGLIADTIRFKIEKQGEQKPVDKVEPKFKVGDIIRHKEQRCTCKITAVDTTTAEYGVSECSGTHLPFDFQDAWELVEQKPAEWSEEDEDILNTIINHFKIDIECTDEDDVIRWLKSLKGRYTWEPSDEQLNTLHWCVMNVGSTEYQVLQELLEQLEKLKL